MAKVIDLREMKKEDLEIKLLDGKVVTIPGDIDAKFMSDILKMEEKLNANTKEGASEQLDVLVDMVHLTLNLDKEAKITKKYIREELNISAMNVILSATFDHLRGEMTKDK